MRSRIAPILLVLILSACAGNKDNSEPPAELTIIENPIKLDVHWVVDARASVNVAAYRLRPLIVDDRVYSVDTSGLVRSLDLKFGRILWEYKTGLEPITGLVGSPELLIVTSRNGDVVAFREVDDSLIELWRANVGSEVRASPQIDGEQVFVRGVDGRLYSLASANGTQLWQVSRVVPSLSLTGTSNPVIVGEMVISGFDDGRLIAYDRNSGKTQWETAVSLPRGRTEVERLVDLDGRFIVRDGVIYVVSFQGHLAAVQALNGDVLWTRKFSSYQALAIDDDAIYLSSDDSDLWAIDRRTGSAFWKQDVLHARRITAPSIVGDKLVVADLEGFLHWFSKSDGQLLGRVRPTPQRNYVQPVIWEERVIILDKLGFLAAVSARL